MELDEEVNEVIIELLDRIENICHLSFDHDENLKSNQSLTNTLNHQTLKFAVQRECFHFDECKAFLEQVSSCFDLGTIEVRLNCLTTSPNYFAVGSTCGALFLFNQKINRSARPLKTTCDEVITCLDIYSSLEKEMLAIGHQSGTLIILFLPSSNPNGNRKMNQSILEEPHNGFAVQCLCWSYDGSKLFSANSNGSVVMTHVDFINNVFLNTFVCNEPNVFSMISIKNFFVISSETVFKIMDTSTNCSLILNRDLLSIKNLSSLKINGISFYDEELLLLMLENGKIFAQHLNFLHQFFEFKDLSKLVKTEEQSKHFSTITLSPSKEIRTFDSFNSDDFLLSRIVSINSGHFLVYFSIEKILVCHFQNAEDLVKIEVFDLKTILDDEVEFEILDVVCQENTNEIFILTSHQRIFRLSKLPAPSAILFVNEETKNSTSASVSVLLNSLSVAAQKSSKNFFGKFERLQNNQSVAAGLKFVDQFFVGNHSSSTVEKTNNFDLNLQSLTSRNFDERLVQDCNVDNNELSANTNKLQNTISEADHLSKNNEAGLSQSTPSQNQKIDFSEIFSSSTSDARLFLPFSPKSLGISDEYSSKITANIQSIFGHLKNTNILSDFDTQSQKNYRQLKDDLLSDDNILLTTNEFNEEIEIKDGSSHIVENTKSVNVLRRAKIKSKRKNALQNNFASIKSSNVDDCLTLPTIDNTVKIVPKIRGENVPDLNLKKILGVIGLSEMSPIVAESSSNTFSENIKLSELIYSDDDFLKSSSSHTTSVNNCQVPECDFYLAATNQFDDAINDKKGIHNLTLEHNCINDFESFKTNENFHETIAKSDLSLASTETNDKEVATKFNTSVKSVFEDFLFDGDMSNIASNVCVTVNSNESKYMNLIGSLEEDNIEQLTLEKSILANYANDNNYNDSKDLKNLENGASLDGEMETTSSSLILNENEITSSNVSLEIKANVDYSVILSFVLSNNNLCDDWSYMRAPFVVAQFSVSKNYIVICPFVQKKFFWMRRQQIIQQPLCKSFIDKGVSDWQPVKSFLNNPITAISVNDNGNLIWQISNGIGYASKELTANPFLPDLSNMDEQTGKAEGDLISISLTSQNAWYLSKNGVFVQMNLPTMGIFYRAECSFELTQLVASDYAVWALHANSGNLTVRVGLQHCPMGFDWVEAIPEISQKFVSIALFEHSGFGLDSTGNLWIINGVSETTPYGIGAWFKVDSFAFKINELMSSDINLTKSINIPEQWTLSVSSAGVFVCLGELIVFARTSITGHLVNIVKPRFELYDEFSLISCGSYCGISNESIYLVSQSRTEVFQFSIKHRIFTSLPSLPTLPLLSIEDKIIDFKKNFNDSDDCDAGVVEKVNAISVCSDRIFILMNTGTIYARHIVLNVLAPFYSVSQTFNGWSKVSLPTYNTLSPKYVVSIASSSNSVWIINSKHKIFYLNLLHIEDFNMKWTKISRPKETLMSANVRVSPSLGKYAWVFSLKSGLAWVRVGISNDNQHGRNWLIGPSNLKICDMAVGENVVWALESITYQLYRLEGINTVNPSGRFWQPISHFRFRTISIDSFENRIWGLNMEHQIVRHEMNVFSLHNDNEKNCQSSNKIQKKLFEGCAYKI